MPTSLRVISVGFYPGPDPSPTDSDPYPVDPAGSGPGRFASADPGAGLLNNQAYPTGEHDFETAMITLHHW